MEQTTNALAPTAATDEPAVPASAPPAHRPSHSLARISPRLAESLVEPALECGRDSRSGRVTRHDGWTPERIRTFLDTLAETGVVADAARAAGMSTTSCYRLRNRTGARPFRLAWTAAEHNARRRVADEAMSRALNGCVEIRVKGDVVEERHRFDNRLLMTVLARLDRNAVADDRENRAARFIADEFDQYLDLLCAGGEGASDFLATRYEIDSEYDCAPEATMLERSENYACLGTGLPEEVPAADPAPEESWLPYRQERPDRAVHLPRLADDADGEEDEDDDVEHDEDAEAFGDEFLPDEEDQADERLSDEEEAAAEEAELAADEAVEVPAGHAPPAQAEPAEAPPAETPPAALAETAEPSPRDPADPEPAPAERPAFPGLHAAPSEAQAMPCTTDVVGAPGGPLHYPGRVASE